MSRKKCYAANVMLQFMTSYGGKIVADVIHGGKITLIVGLNLHMSTKNLTLQLTHS